jgi:predicted adenylyl cyclase CyaB
MRAPRRNLELKARCPDLEAVVAKVGQLGARDAGLEVQTDTYFHVASGRLKLREIEGKPAVLIGYARPDQVGARLSKYHLVPVPDALAMKVLLADTLGVRSVVSKRRRIWLWQNVRIHLDEVMGLGSFVEFEAVIRSPEEEIAAPGQIGHLRQFLSIELADHVAESYVDLLMR